MMNKKGLLMTFGVTLVAVLLVYMWWGGRPSSSLAELQGLYEKGALLVDVRTLGEVQSSPVAGATHIPLHEVKARKGELPKDRDVIFFCRSGRRSASAMRLMKREGWTRVHNGGGYRPWLSIVKPKTR